jgi:endonuclease/exonuclease/phosphatase family metal-dependent hydrolase
MKILTWNLFHGRAQPPAGRALLPEFTAAIAAWDWDVACLQEVPPWWPRRLAEACDASMRMVLTSRNGLLPLRRFVADRWPDVIKSNGGGSNAILVRGESISEHVELPLRQLPERRFCQIARLGSAACVANIHASKQPRQRPLRDIERAAAAIDGWACDTPAVWAGDFNIRDPAPRGWARVASHGVDHVLVRGFEGAYSAVLDAGRLSDHRPVVVDLAG